MRWAPWAALCAACVIESAGAASPSDPQAHWAEPSGVFGQVGLGQHTRTLVVGATWSLHWQHELGPGRLSSYLEVNAGRWFIDNAPQDGADAITQIGIVPVLRWTPADAQERWFLDGGIGLSWIFPLYRSGIKHFPTTLNFATHVGVGWTLGEARKHEVLLRWQHHSNSGFESPNPGEDFLTVRYGFLF